MGKSAADLVGDAKAQVENLTPEQVAKEMEGGDVVIVDIRESEELVATGRIPGAVHVPRGLLEFKTADIDPSKRVILHCAAGGRSALAAVTLKEMGYDNVAHLDGGMTAWLNEGRPVEKG